jgi:hypothetical protein|tara:strand:- start:669 stop:875 length:207 start_codon:yes stop_codon:yes gene_type:complete
LLGSVKGLSFVIAKANKKGDVMINNTWTKVAVSAAVIVFTQVASQIAQQVLEHALDRVKLGTTKRRQK